jgi:hypothetical protein
MPTILKTKNSVTTTVAPTTLQQGELAVNITDKKLWVGNAASTPVQIVGAGTTGTAAGSNTQVQYNSSGTLAGDADFTFNGTTVTMANDASISELRVGQGNTAGVASTALGAATLNSNTGAYVTGVGYQALYANTSGTNNTGLGFYALVSNTTASNNTALGNQAMQLNTTGATNTAVGSLALYSNTTASFNTAVGYQASYSNTVNSGNTAVGYQALYSSTASNTAFGYQAGYSATSSGNMTAIGYRAFYTANPSTTNGNTGLGHEAGVAVTTGKGNTLVGNVVGASLTTGSKNTFVGGSDNTSNFSAGYFVTTGSSNTIVGCYSGNQGGLDIRTASNYAVISDGDGNPLISTSQGRSVALEGAVPQTGEGITFPATQVASSNANTLDDYEEGTWTPSLVSTGGGAPSYSTREGRYYKIGGIVYVFGIVQISGTLPAGNYTRIQGLPFTQSSVESAAAIKYSNATTVPSGQFITAAIGGSEISFARCDGNGEIGAVGLNASYISTTFRVSFSTFYQVA